MLTRSSTLYGQTVRTHSQSGAYRLFVDSEARIVGRLPGCDDCHVTLHVLIHPILPPPAAPGHTHRTMAAFVTNSVSLASAVTAKPAARRSARSTVVRASATPQDSQSKSTVALGRRDAVKLGLGSAAAALQLLTAVGPGRHMLAAS